MLGAAGGVILATGGKWTGGEYGVHDAGDEWNGGGLLGGGSGRGMGATTGAAGGGSSAAGACIGAGGDGVVTGSGARGGAGGERSSGAGTCRGGDDGAVKSGGAGGGSGGVIVRSNLALGCRACTLCSTTSTSATTPACTRSISVTCIVAPSAWLPPPSRRLSSDGPCTSVHTTAQPVASASSASHFASRPSTVMLVVSLSTE